MKTVLITGATSGIGRASALELAAAGHHVIATGRSADALASLRAAARGRLDTVVLDVTRPAQVDAAFATVEALTEGEGIDVLVNNAGFGIVAPTSELEDAELRAQFETNVFGLMTVTRAFVPGMRRRGRGTIINVSSVGGRLTLPFLGGYNATKYAVESLSDALRRELHAFGIRVVVLEPGLVNTRFTEKSTTGIDRWGRRDSAYAGSFAQAQAMIEQSTRFGVAPRRLARVVRRIAESRRPRARYVSPFSGRLTLWLTAWLPTPVVDLLLRRLGHLRRRDLRPATATPLPLAPRAA